MTQPSWPFEYSVAGTWEPLGQDPEDDDSFMPEGSEPDRVVYLVEGSQLAYGTKRAWDETSSGW